MNKPTIDYSEPNVKGQFLIENTELKERILGLEQLALTTAQQLDKREEKLREISELPEKWREDELANEVPFEFEHNGNTCADELQAIIEKADER